ncbi:hypothetical protein ACIQVA_39020 [Streptomyces microflavus]|uniref:hypothetical protein n=1 Tax=Streptomyces microflavus TaxID=1919 RepID=UPI003810EE3A
MVRASFTPEERLARLRANLGDDPKVSRSANRMRMNRPANVLAGATLHAAARQEAGLELSDLEQGLVEVMRAFVTDEEIAGCGQAWRQASASTTASLFPQQITALPVETPYAFEDLAADLPGLAAQILAQPNVSIVNLAESGPGGGVDTPDTAAAEYGGSAVTVITAPRDGAQPLATTSTVKVTLREFQCLRNTNDQWGGADEIYWVAGSGGDMGDQGTYRSPVFGDLWSGYRKDFAAETNVFHGEFHKSLILNIECWEEDNGDIFKELQKQLWKISQACADAAVSIKENGQSEDAALAAVIAIVTALLTWLLGWLSNDDDLVGERSIGITDAATRYIAAHAGEGHIGPDDVETGPASTRRLVWDFSSSEGHYRLQADLRVLSRQDKSLLTRRWTPVQGWGPETEAPIPGIAKDAPGVGMLDQTMHMIYRDPTHAYRPISYIGGKWVAGSPLAGAIRVPCSPLVAMGGLLATMYGTNSTLGLVPRNQSSGRWSWSGFVRGFESDEAHGPVALTELLGKLYCVYRPEKSNTLRCVAVDPKTMTCEVSTPAITGSEGGRNPALARIGTTLFCVYRTASDGIAWATSVGGETWTAHGTLTGSIGNSPALTVEPYADVLHCVVRSPGTSGALWTALHRRHTGWTPFTRLTGSLPAATGPALVTDKDSMHLFYRR